MIFFAVIAAILLLVLTFKYPVISIVFFLTSSVIKTDLTVRFEIFQKFDLTVLASCYILFGMIVALSKRPWDIKKVFNTPLLLMFLLACVLFMGLTYTSAPNYGWQKSTRYFVFGVIMFISPIIFVSNKSDLKRILWILLLIGVFIGIFTIAMPHAAVYRERTEERAGFLEAGPLETAEKIAVACLIAFSFMIFKDSTKKTKIISLAVIPVALFGVVLTGSRGSFLAMVLGCIITPFLFGRRMSLKWFIPAVIIAVVGMVYAVVFAENVAEGAVDRIANIWREEGGFQTLSQSRLGRFSWTLSHIPSSPIIGHGTGSFAMDWDGKDMISYPHNIILELWYETGIFGVICFGGFIYMIYKKWRYVRNCIKNNLGDDELFLYSSIGGVLFLFALIQAMKSNDIDGNRFLFFCAGLIISVFYVATETFRQIGEDGYSDNINFQQTPTLYGGMNQDDEN